MDSWFGSLLIALLATGFVLVLAWAGLRLLARMDIGTGSRAGVAGAPDLRFIRALPLGPRERIVVIDYDNTRLLVGVTAGGMTLLRTDPAPPPSAQPSAHRAAPPAARRPAATGIPPQSPNGPG